MLARIVISSRHTFGETRDEASWVPDLGKQREGKGKRDAQRSEVKEKKVVGQQ